VAEQERMEKDKSAGSEAGKGTRSAPGALPWVITALIAVILAGAGFGIGRLFGTRGRAQTAGAAEPAPAAAPARGQEPGASKNADEGWFYDLDPVVANLNEPGVTRYARVALTLEINSTIAQKEATATLDQKKPLMKHWLTLYLANQTLEEIRGEKNLLRMQAQILDGFNQTLFPNGKPQIQRILFKEFAIQ
jgi:flagellar basal body-associated protein FliL